MLMVAFKLVCIFFLMASFMLSVFSIDNWKTYRSNLEQIQNKSRTNFTLKSRKSSSKSYIWREGGCFQIFWTLNSRTSNVIGCEWCTEGGVQNFDCVRSLSKLLQKLRAGIQKSRRSTKRQESGCFLNFKSRFQIYSKCYGKSSNVSILILKYVYFVQMCLAIGVRHNKK